MRTVLSVCPFAGILLLAMPAASQDDKTKKGDQPGPVHEQLTRLVGEYTTASTMRLKPDQPPIETAGAAKITTIHGGRFILEENSGTSLGEKITGLRLVGFNNNTGKYEATWTYSMSTAQMSLTGTSKDGGKTIEWSGTFTKGKGDNQTLYVTTRILSNDRFEVELFAKTEGGGKGPTLVTTYTRKKG